jgi:hypothetical protein
MPAVGEDDSQGKINVAAAADDWLFRFLHELLIAPLLDGD